MFGAGGGTSSYREVEDTDLIVLWGSNARETHPIFFHHVLRAVNKSARLYAVDPRRTSSAEWADAWLGLDVGSDIALANAIRAGLSMADGMRLGTVSLHVTFTGRPLRGPLVAEARCDGWIEAAVSRQGIARCEVRSGGALACLASGMFMELPPPPGVRPISSKAGCVSDSEPARPRPGWSASWERWCARRG